MKKKFVENQRVGCPVDENGELTATVLYHGEYTDEPEYGKVTEVLTGGKVKVLWDHDYLNDHSKVYNKTTGKLQKEISVPSEVEAKWLLPEAEMKTKYDELEKEYDAVAKEVKAKLSEAAKIIREANKIAKKSGASSLHEMYDAVGPLEEAMDACGWNSSSWSC